MVNNRESNLALTLDNVPRNGQFCQTYCPKNKFDFNSNECEDCNGGCNNSKYSMSCFVP